MSYVVVTGTRICLIVWDFIVVIKNSPVAQLVRALH